jgi:hypothetical protein
VSRDGECYLCQGETLKRKAVWLNTESRNTAEPVSSVPAWLLAGETGSRRSDPIRAAATAIEAWADCPLLPDVQRLKLHSTNWISMAVMDRTASCTASHQSRLWKFWLARCEGKFFSGHAMTAWGGGGGADREAIHNLILKLQEPPLKYNYNSTLLATAFMYKCNYILVVHDWLTDWMTTRSSQSWESNRSSHNLNHSVWYFFSLI